MSYHVSKYLDDIKTSCPASTSAGADHALCLYFAKLAYRGDDCSSKGCARSRRRAQSSSEAEKVVDSGRKAAPQNESRQELDEEPKVDIEHDYY
jgi:hypothetical protein